jgi:PAS domain S-box-containing protein
MIPVGILSLLAFEGCLYNATPLFFGASFHTAMPLSTAVLFLVIFSGVLFCRPGCGLMVLISSEDISGKLVRRTLPVTFLIPLTLGWLKLYWYRTGVISDEFGVSFVAAGNIILISLCIYALSFLIRKTNIERIRTVKELETLVRDSNDAITIQDFEGNITAWNHGAELMYGYSEEDALQMNIGILTPPDKMAEQNDFIRRIIAGEAIISFETQRVTKDGCVLDAWLTVTKLMDDTGKPVGIASTERDVTERKKKNDQLLAATEEWRTTFDSISDMVSIHGINWEIIRVNKAFADIFKLKPQDVIGKKCYEIIHSTNEPPSYCPHRCALATKMPQRSEYFEPNLGLHLEVTTSPIFNEKGDMVASVHIARDISHRKKLEKNQRLTDLGKLVADMAHEVNNPLMIISGNAQLSLLDGTPSEEIKNNLKIIHEESNRAKDIIQRLLKFSRPTKGVQKETDINQSIESVVKLLEHQYGLSDVNIKKDFSENLPVIVTDEKQIQEVLMNLLNNAREAMLDGGTIDISTSLEQDFLRIDIKDTGMGMKAETLSKIFVPFFTTKEKGTGLGLPVCLGIVRAHNGELKFESQPGKGTIATMLLPIRGGVRSNA